MEDQELPKITTEVLSEIIGQNVKSFTIKPGSSVGDNYMSVLYTIQVELEKPNNNGEKKLSLLSKCFPSHPGRQQYLKLSNIFYNEFKVYETFIPTLAQMAQEYGINEKLPFPQLIGGKAVDFNAAKESGKVDDETQTYGPFDNFIMMPDLRAYGFRMVDRKIGLDLEHTKLVMKAYAKLHSLSWAYKVKNNLDSIVDKFPFLEFNSDDGIDNMFINAIKGAIETALEIMKPDSKIYDRTKNLHGKLGEMWKIIFRNADNYTTELANFHRIKPILPNGPEWKVIVHGDCWVNNMLFRYNNDSVEDQKPQPKELVLVDLQFWETCPTSDLVYVIYSSTDQKLRHNHLEELLQLYHDEFVRHCTILEVKSLPNFSLQELKNRFHISKIYGFTIAMMILPIMLKNSEDIEDPEKRDSESGMEELLLSVTDKVGMNREYIERVFTLAQELYEDGVL